MPYTYNFGAWESSQGAITDHWSSFGQGHVDTKIEVFRVFLPQN